MSHLQMQVSQNCRLDLQEFGLRVLVSIEKITRESPLAQSLIVGEEITLRGRIVRIEDLSDEVART